jgi:predicted esterase
MTQNLSIITGYSAGATVRFSFWWNGSYFGCIFTIKGMLPKPKVCYQTLILIFASELWGPTFQ